MALKGYGVLKGHPVETMLEPKGAHLEIHVSADNKDYRIAFNVKSTATPPELRYMIYKDFEHPVTEKFKDLPEGVTLKDDKPEIGLDFIRENLLDYRKMKTAHYIEGKDNELADLVELYLEKAINNENAVVYAFGQTWGPEEKEDMYYGFTPGQGIHDIHRNQGNAGSWEKDNGTYQDGAMMLYFPADGNNGEQWVAFFAAFQSQAYHTDDNGNPLFDVNPDDEQSVLIISALLKPKSGDRMVRLINTKDTAVSLEGWELHGEHKSKISLGGSVEAGGCTEVNCSDDLKFSENGGTLTLTNDKGMIIDGVCYSTPEYMTEGLTTVFR